MRLIEVTKIDQLKKGDTIVLTGHPYDKQFFKIPHVKVSEQDGTEVIINMKKNHFFNLGMYLKGKSWVKECKQLID